MDHVKKARELFLEGYNCAQAVFAAFCDVTGMDFETALKLSSSFGGGMGRMREVCGACSAMFMVCGMTDGYSSPIDDKAKADHYARIQQLAEQFRARNNTIICRELMNAIEAGTSPVPTKRTDEFYAQRPCLKFVEDCAAILEEYLNR